MLNPPHLGNEKTDLWGLLFCVSLSLDSLQGGTNWRDYEGGELTQNPALLVSRRHLIQSIRRRDFELFVNQRVVLGSTVSPSVRPHRAYARSRGARELRAFVVEKILQPLASGRSASTRLR